MEIQYSREQYAEFLCKAYRLNRIIEPLEKTPHVRIFIDASDSEHVIISSTHANGIVFSRHLDCVVRKVSDNPNRIFTLKQTLSPIYEKLMRESDDPYYTVNLFPRLSLSNDIMEALPYYKDSTQITNIPLTEPVTKFIKKTGKTVQTDYERSDFSGMCYISVTDGKFWFSNIGLRLLGYVSVQIQPGNLADINSAETYRIPIDSIPLIYTVFGESDNESIKVLSLPSKYHLMAFQAGSETLYVPRHTREQIRPRQCTMAGNEYRIHSDLPFKPHIDNEQDYSDSVAMVMETSSLKKALKNLKLCGEKNTTKLTIEIVSDKVIGLMSWHTPKKKPDVELDSLLMTLSRPVESYESCIGMKFHTTFTSFYELVDALSSHEIEIYLPRGNKPLYAVAYSEDKTTKYGIKTVPLSEGFKGR